MNSYLIALQLPLDALDSDTIHTGSISTDTLGRNRWVCSCGSHGLYMHRSDPYHFAFLWRCHVYEAEHWRSDKGRIIKAEHETWKNQEKKERRRRNGFS